MYLPEFNHSLENHGSAVPALEAVEGCYDIRDCRTLSNIVWSCLATVFACTWVAIHPNIPAQDAPWARKFGRRVVATVCAIIAPDLIVLWAAKQWVSSSRLARRYKGGFLLLSHDRHWTQSHGFFAIMGGFVMYHGNETYKVVDAYKDLPKLGSNVRPLRYITEEEIKDKSKGGWLSKGLVIVQTSWFIAQCIARSAQGLALTELELSTCAYAALNAMAYGLWWNKPQSVDRPHRI
ncbi:hypothetical protein OE88DRAFT_1700952, partial [Heliocybe sulcata]